MKDLLTKLYNKISDKIKKIISKSSPRWLVLLIDVFLVVTAFIFSYLIRFNFSFRFGEHHIKYQILLIIVLSLISFLITGSYRGIIRHTGFKDIISVTKSATIISLLLLLIVGIVRNYDILEHFNMPLSVIGIHYFVSIFMLIGSRMIYKGFYQKLENHLQEPKKVIIHGAHTGKAVYDAILAEPNSKYEVICFVDDRSEYIGKLIHRKEVYPPRKITESFVVKKDISEVIISKPEASPLELLEIANKYLDIGLKVKTVPHINQWIDDEKITIGQIKELNIEELLNRSPIKIDNPVIKKDIENKVILITGAAGSIGSEIANQVMHFNPKQLVMIDIAESALYDVQQDFIRKGYDTKRFTSIVGDVRDKFKMDEYFARFQPDIIYHAAAYKHVPLMERNPYEALKINVLGSKNIMDLAIKHQVGKFVMISTDKAVNPTNVMGATKRAAEIYATCSQKKTKNTKFIITRFGNVLGSNGSVIPLFKKQIKKGGPLTVTHKEITRYFMTIPEACNLVLEAGTMGNGGEIFVFDMGEPVKIFDLAKKMIQLSGYEYPKDIDIIITGLRPGEKLYEETLGKNEGDLPTHNEKVMIAQINDVNCEEVCMYFKELNNYQNLTHFEIVQILKKMIPEYISNNSEFEELDKITQ